MDNSSPAARGNDAVLVMELKKLGLSRREALVYLFVMQQQSTTVCDVARNVRISRPTAYRTIYALEEKHLINKVRKNRKTLLLAAAPDALLSLFKIKQRELQEQEREFLRMISLLQTAYAAPHDTDSVRAYTHAGTFHVLRDDLLATTQRQCLIFYGAAPPPKLSAVIKSVVTKIPTYAPRAIIRVHAPRQRVPRTLPTVIVTDRVFIVDTRTVTIVTHPMIREAFFTLCSTCKTEDAPLARNAPRTRKTVAKTAFS